MEPGRTVENTQQAEYAVVYFFLLASSSSRCRNKRRQYLWLGCAIMGITLAARNLRLPSCLAWNFASRRVLAASKPRSSSVILRGASAVVEGGRAKLMRVVAALRSSPCGCLSDNKEKKGRRAYSGVTLLGLAGLAWEDNQLGLISLQPLDVECLALLAQVPPPVINNDTNTASLLLANASLLQFSKSEPTSLPKFPVIADRLGTNSRPE